ncbi:MAG: iron chaperone [Methanobacterium sp.]
MEKNRKELKTFNDYKMDYPPEIQKRLEEIRQAVKSVVPEAKERISYNMPSFWFHGNLLYYGAFKNHIGFYPASKTVFEKFKDELKIYKQSGKGTVQFPYDKPIPLKLIQKIAKIRANENTKKR